MKIEVAFEKVIDLFWRVNLQIGDEKFDFAFLGSQPDADRLKDRLFKTLSSLDIKEKPKSIPPPNKGCNFHVDCRQANEIAKSKGKLWAEHCSDEFCEDCFGT
jgi:hypothetical protein